MFNTDPGGESGAEREVEKPLVGDCEDDEGRRKGQKYHYKAMEVVCVWL